MHTKPMMAWTSEYLTPAPPGVSEDCLSLNIWALSDGLTTKCDATSYPVLVFIYGGGFTEYGYAVPSYDGVNLAKRGIVVVTLNYRLGTLGFLAHPLLSREQNGGVEIMAFRTRLRPSTGSRITSVSSVGMPRGLPSPVSQLERGRL